MQEIAGRQELMKELAFFLEGGSVRRKKPKLEFSRRSDVLHEPRSQIDRRTADEGNTKAAVVVCISKRVGAGAMIHDLIANDIVNKFERAT